MLRKFQAILAVFTTLVVFVIFSFFIAPVGKAVGTNFYQTDVWDALLPSGESSVRDMAVDSFGIVYANTLLNSGQYLIRKFDQNGNSLGTFISTVNQYGDLAFNSAGYLVVIRSGSSIETYDTEGNLTASFLLPTLGFPGDPYRNARDIAIAPNGNILLYVFGGPFGEDPLFEHQYIRIHSGDGTLVDEVELPYTNFGYDGLTIDSAGDIYIATQGTINKYDSSGTFLYDLANGSHVTDMDVDLNDVLYAKDLLSNITAYDSSGNFLWSELAEPNSAFTYMAIDNTTNGFISTTFPNQQIVRYAFGPEPTPTPTLTASPTPSPTDPPIDLAWETVGTEIPLPDGSGHDAQIFVRTDKTNQTPLIAFDDYDAGAGNSKVSVMQYNSGSNTWSYVGGRRFSNTLRSNTVSAFAFDTCSDGSMVVIISDATQVGKGTTYRYEGGAWGVLGSAGFSTINGNNSVGVLCQTDTNFPYLYLASDTNQSAAYNYNIGLGGWVDIQSIPCAETSNIGSSSNLVDVDPNIGFIWYSCTTGEVSEFTGQQWNVKTNPDLLDPSYGVKDFAYEQTSGYLAFAAMNGSSDVAIFGSLGGSNLSQFGTISQMGNLYSFSPSLIYNSTAARLWFAMPTNSNAFTVKQYDGGQWSDIVAPFTETYPWAFDMDLYHDPVCTGADYLGMLNWNGPAMQIVVKRLNSYVPCPILATVTTGAISAITDTTATVAGNVSHAGYSTITERGVVYSSTVSVPTMSDTIQPVSGTTGAMSVPLGGLTAETHYYARAFATNSVGTAYGAVVEFTTTAIPIVPTTATPTPTVTPSRTGTVTPTPTGTVTPTVSIPPVTTLPPTTVPTVTLSPRREAQQSPVCPIIVRFVSNPTIAEKDEKVTLTWITSHATKTIIDGSELPVSAELEYFVKDSRKVKLIADNGACIASANIDFSNQGEAQLQVATTIGASALVADILLQQIVTMGSASLGSSAVLSANLWGIALSVFDRKKKKQAWGIAYDSVSKVPLGRVVIRLLNLDSEEVVDTVVSDAQGVFQLKTQPGRYIIRVVRSGYLFPSKKVSGVIDGGYSNLYYGSVIIQSAKDKQVLVAIPLDPIDETAARKKSRKIFEYGMETLSTVSTVALFAGLGYSMYVAVLFPLPINIIATLIYGVICFGKIAVTLWAPKNFGKVSDISGKPVTGIEIGIFDKEFNTLLYRTFTNEKGEYNFAVPNRNYNLKVMDSNYKLYSNKGADSVPILKLKNKNEMEIRLLTEDMLIKRVSSAI